jgi:hypothetical protein
MFAIGFVQARENITRSSSSSRPPELWMPPRATRSLPPFRSRSASLSSQDPGQSAPRRWVSGFETSIFSPRIRPRATVAIGRPCFFDALRTWRESPTTKFRFAPRSLHPQCLTFGRCFGVTVHAPHLVVAAGFRESFNHWPHSPK